MCVNSRRPFTIGLGLCLCLSSSIARAQHGQDSEQLAEITELRRIVLEHAAQFKSFKGSYHFAQRSENEQLLEYEFDSRIQAKDIYLDKLDRSASAGNDGSAGGHEVYTTWNGVISARLNQSGETTVMLGTDGWMSPPMAYMDPRVLFLEIHGRTAEEWMAVGTDTVHHRDGMRVLSHLMERCACSYDVYIDDAGHVRRLEYAMRLLEPDEEVRKYWTGDLFDVRRVERAWEFDGYQVLDGVTCSTLATAIWYRHDDALSERLWALRDSGKISNLEAWVRNYVENPAVPVTEQTFEFMHPEAIVFNAVLGKEDFELEIPVGAAVMDVTKNFSYRVQPKRWYQRIPSDAWIALGLVAVLTALTLAGWGLWKRYG